MSYFFEQERGIYVVSAHTVEHLQEQFESSRTDFFDNFSMFMFFKAGRGGDIGDKGLPPKMNDYDYVFPSTQDITSALGDIGGTKLNVFSDVEKYSIDGAYNNFKSLYPAGAKDYDQPGVIGNYEKKRGGDAGAAIMFADKQKVITGDGENDYYIDQMTGTLKIEYKASEQINHLAKSYTDASIGVRYESVDTFDLKKMDINGAMKSHLLNTDEFRYPCQFKYYSGRASVGPSYHWPTTNYGVGKKDFGTMFIRNIQNENQELLEFDNFLTFSNKRYLFWPKPNTNIFISGSGVNGWTGSAITKFTTGLYYYDDYYDGDLTGDNGIECFPNTVPSVNGDGLWQTGYVFLLPHSGSIDDYTLISRSTAPAIIGAESYSDVPTSINDFDFFLQTTTGCAFRSRATGMEPTFNMLNFYVLELDINATETSQDPNWNGASYFGEGYDYSAAFGGGEFKRLDPDNTFYFHHLWNVGGYIDSRSVRDSEFQCFGSRVNLNLSFYSPYEATGNTNSFRDSIASVMTCLDLPRRWESPKDDQQEGNDETLNKQYPGIPNLVDGFNEETEDPDTRDEILKGWREEWDKEYMLPHDWDQIIGNPLTIPFKLEITRTPNWHNATNNTLVSERDNYIRFVHDGYALGFSQNRVEEYYTRLEQDYLNLVENKIRRGGEERPGIGYDYMYNSFCTYDTARIRNKNKFMIIHHGYDFEKNIYYFGANGRNFQRKMFREEFERERFYATNQNMLIDPEDPNSETTNGIYHYVAMSNEDWKYDGQYFHDLSQYDQTVIDFIMRYGGDSEYGDEATLRRPSFDEGDWIKSPIDPRKLAARWMRADKTDAGRRKQVLLEDEEGSRGQNWAWAVERLMTDFKLYETVMYVNPRTSYFSGLNDKITQIYESIKEKYSKKCVFAGINLPEKYRLSQFDGYLPNNTYNPQADVTNDGKTDVYNELPLDGLRKIYYSSSTSPHGHLWGKLQSFTGIINNT